MGPVRLLASLAAALLGCQGQIGPPTFLAGGPGGAGGEPRYLVDTPAPFTRAARLSHEQWERSVQDLLRLDARPGLSGSFRADPAQGGFLFGNDAQSLEVDQALWATYQRAAADVAERVVADPAALGRLLPAAASDEERARQLIADLGGRAHRRPLTEDQIDDYLALWTAGRDLYAGVPALEAGVRLVLEAMLQSPYFLYRIEASTAPDGSVIPLDGWEIASRLSYMLWNTMPDDELFAAAENGELEREEDVAAQVGRMLVDPRAADVVARFHEMLFDVETYGGIAPSPAFFPDAPPDLGTSAAAEHDLFVRDVFERRQGLGELLTSSRSFVNDSLARVYGLDGQFGQELVPISLDPAQRRGILTHAGFLAHNATSVNDDPIHRGVFVARRLACISIAAPPANVPPLPAIDESMTTRQAVEAHTEQPGSVCSNCHETIINRFGFAFEAYDALGAFRIMEAGQTVDTATEPPIDGRNVPVADALELADRLAASQDVHDCYVQHWIEYAYGRPIADQDAPLIERLGARSRNEGLSIEEIVAGLATSRAFLGRSLEELP